MIQAIFSIWAVLAGISLLMAGSGLQGALLGIRAAGEGFPALVTGIVMSCYFAGFVIGSLTTPILIRRVGHIRVFSALASLASVAALLHAVIVEPSAWAMLRILTGFCYIGLFVAAESWLNTQATDLTRGRLLSVYLIIMTGSMAAGPLFLNFGESTGYALFVVASVLVSVAVIPVALTTYAAPPFERQERFSLRELTQASPLGVAGCLINGATVGALVWLATVYGAELGMSVEEVSLFTSASILGGTILVWPLGRLSDRFDRRKVLTGTAALGGLGAFAAAVLEAPDPWIQIAFVATIGSFATPLYSLSVAHTNDRLETDKMVAASSSLLLTNGIGGMCGPALAGVAMQVLGPSGYFWFPAFAMLLLTAFALFRMTRRKAIPNEEQVDFVQLPRTSGVLTRAALEERTD